MKIFFLLLFIIALATPAFAEEPPVKDSFVQFPYVVFVGQVVDITPQSVIVQNTRATTELDNDRLTQLINRLSNNHEDASHAFGSTLKLVTVNNGHMQLNFYLDNINTVFHQDINTYLQFLPLFYMFKNNIKEMDIPKDLVAKLNAVALDKYISLPLVKEIMKNSWFAGIFRVNPESQKLVYYDSRFYENFEELQQDDMAREFNVEKIVEKGMAVTMSVTTIRGNESKISSMKNTSKNGKIGGNKKPLNGGGSEKDGSR